MGPILPNDMIYRAVHIIFSRYCDNPILHTQVEKLPPTNVGQPKKLINSFPTSHPLPPLIYYSYPLLPFPSLPLLYAKQTHTHTKNSHHPRKHSPEFIHSILAHSTPPKDNGIFVGDCSTDHNFCRTQKASWLRHFLQPNEAVAKGYDHASATEKQG